jgi:hypothetical protein
VNNDSNHNPKFWSVYDRVLNGVCGTTNSVEGYNRHLNNVCNTNNPTVVSLGIELVKEYEINAKKMMDSLFNFWTIKNTKHVCNEIYCIVENFEKYYDVEFLKAIFKNFRFPLNK